MWYRIKLWLTILGIAVVVAVRGLIFTWSLVAPVMDSPAREPYKVRYVGPEHILATKGLPFTCYFVRYEKNRDEANIIVREGCKLEARKMWHSEFDQKVVLTGHPYFPNERWEATDPRLERHRTELVVAELRLAEAAVREFEKSHEASLQAAKR